MGKFIQMLLTILEITSLANQLATRWNIPAMSQWISAPHAAVRIVAAIAVVGRSGRGGEEKSSC